MKKIYAINGFLVAILALVLWLRHDRVSHQSTPVATSETNRAISAKMSPGAKSGNFYATPWLALNMKDYPALIETLRAGGCPEQTIQDLVYIQLCRDYRARKTASFDQQHMNREWWRGKLPIQNLSGLMPRYENAARVWELLGVDTREIESRWFGFSEYQPLNWLSPEKELQLNALLRRFQNESYEIMHDPVSNQSLHTDSNVQEQQKELEKSQRAVLQAFLTPSELVEYDMTYSKESTYVRESLPPATTEQEFRTMVAIVQKYGIPEGVKYEASDLRQKIESALGSDVVAKQLALAEEHKELEDQHIAEAQEEQKEADQKEMVERFTSTATEMGIDSKAAEECGRAVFALVDEMTKDKSKPQPTEEQMEAAVLQTATDILGEKGSNFVARLKEKYD